MGQVVGGEATLGVVVKAVKEQLAGLPDGLTYGLLRYLNPDVDLAGVDPPIGFNYLGGWVCRRPRAPMGCGGSAGRVVVDRRHRFAPAAGAHPGSQRGHRRHRHRPVPARPLGVGTLSV
ncbi:linear gramicidin synthetase subunit D domain protein [Mycobacterium xenopi 4042]|uniref:Linear gramicidin synthetase subunit D domain protein n=1 Tax=Mycobacterium xenopi 4042 TaxID=1299334 RepID=X8APM0_MYCXE|nr:linear gramicidin synthetase subunit D domain protein [Mycobacterium xenopi 4042]